MNKLKQALAPVHAGDDLKLRTMARLTVPSPRLQGRGRYQIAAALCGILLALGLLGSWLYFAPVSALRIAINPALELRINRFDQVVAVEPLNQDGGDLADSLNLRFLGYTQALDLLLEDDRIQAYIGQGKILSIEVVCEDEVQSEKLLAAVEDHTSGCKNVHCHAAGAGASQEGSPAQNGHGYRHRHGRHHS